MFFPTLCEWGWWVLKSMENSTLFLKPSPNAYLLLFCNQLHVMASAHFVLSDDWQKRLDDLEKLAANRTEEERSAQQIVDEEVFKQVFIPRRLNEVDK